MYYETFMEFCNKNNIKPGTVARLTGISTATITAWKQGKYTPKQDKLQKIADYFNEPLEVFTKSKVTEKDLPDDEKELLGLIRQLPPEQRELVRNTVLAFLRKQ